MAGWKKGLILLLVLSAMGLCLSGLRSGEDARDAAGRATGIRQVVADLFWLQAYDAWERKSEADFRYYAGLASWADPERWFFVEEMAGVLAYDLPYWHGAQGEALELEKRRQARRVLEQLDALSTRFGDDYRWYLERGLLQLHQLSDISGACAAFKAAALLPEAPKECIEWYLQTESDAEKRQAVWELWLDGRNQRSSNSK